MTEKKFKGIRVNLQEIFGAGKDGFKELLREVLQEVLEQEMTEAIGAGERRKESRSDWVIGRATIAGPW